MRDLFDLSELHDLHESKCSFLSCIEFIRSKVPIFSAHVSGASGCDAALLADDISRAQMHGLRGDV